MKRSITILAIGLVMVALTMSAADATEYAFPHRSVNILSSTLDCEGNACTQVTLTFDEAKQQYKVQNNSDRLVRVEASNLAGDNKILVAAGKTDYLTIKSIVGSYRANYE